MRLAPLVRRYPLYSKSDTALWMLGDIYEKSERKDLAGNYYAQIVKNYPLSSHAADAKGKLKDFGMPIPQADPKALEWMTAEQNTPRPKETVVHKSMGIMHSTPDVHTAAAHGLPNMEPDNDQGGDVLAGGNHSNLGGSSGTGAVVEVVKPGEPTPAGTAPGSASSEDVNSTSSSDAAAGTTAATGTDAKAGTTGTAGAAANDPQAGAATGTGVAEGAAAGNTTPDSSTSADASKTDNTQPASTDTTQ